MEQAGKKKKKVAMFVPFHEWLRVMVIFMSNQRGETVLRVLVFSLQIYLTNYMFIHTRE